MYVSQMKIHKIERRENIYIIFCDIFRDNRKNNLSICSSLTQSWRIIDFYIANSGKINLPSDRQETNPQIYAVIADTYLSILALMQLHNELAIHGEWICTRFPMESRNCLRISHTARRHFSSQCSRLIKGRASNARWCTRCKQLYRDI